MKKIVQKFGGTSLASESDRQDVIAKIVEKHLQGNKLVVVVSAMGRFGSPYSTDTLLSLINTRNLSNKEIDLMISCGEIISAAVLTDEIIGLGYKACFLTGLEAGIITDSNFGEANIIEINSYKIEELLDEDYIVVVPGFQGGNHKGQVTTLGRGGSDISAVAIGKGINCDFIEIFTDVDGVMTADPKIVSQARIIDHLSYSDVYQLAEDGAKIIHPRAVEMAQFANIPLIIRNTLSDNLGTLICNENTQIINQKKSKLINSITYKKDRLQVRIKSRDSDYNLNDIMEKFTNSNISLDLINFLEDNKIFTIDHDKKEDLIKILEEESIKYELVENCSKISVIGYKMRGVPGVMAKVVNALSKSNIKILQTSDSHNTIWCLIHNKDTNKAILALHNEFELYK